MIEKIIDVGIITIIPTEINALKSIFGVSEEFQHYERGDMNYLKTNIYSKVSNRNISVVISFLNKEAGNTEIAIATTRFLHEWFPRLMCLVGISAGIIGKSKIGDVILPSKIHDRQIKVYKNGKYSPRTSTHERSDFMDGIAKLRGIDTTAFIKLCKSELSEDLINAIKARDVLGIDIEHLNDCINILDGSLISDNILIRDDSFFNRILTELDEKCRGAEMEAAGFVRACIVENKEFPWIISRGVSDFGDVAKSDTFQLLAAKTACLALRELLTNCIDINQMPENLRAQEVENSFEFNIMQQIQFAYKNQNWSEVCKIAPILSRYLWLSGQYQLRVAIGDLVVESAAHINNENLRASFFIDDLGWTTYIIGNKDKAKMYIRDGLRLANEVRNYYLMAKAHRHLSSIYRRDGLIKEATKEYDLSLKVSQKIVEESEKTEILAALKFEKAQLLLASDDTENCIPAFEEALVAFTANNDTDRAAKVYSLLGQAYQKRGDIVNAKYTHEAGLKAAYEIGRYDDIKANTMALLSMTTDRNIQNQLLNKILEYCTIKKLYSELRFWHKEKEKLIMKKLN